MAVDLAALLRRYRPERHSAPLRRRPAAALVQAGAGTARRILLDTTAIIHDIGGRIPPGAAALLDAALHFHCSVCLGEICAGVANYHPDAANADQVRETYTELMARIPPHRILTPSPEDWAAAGLITGTLARTQGLQRHQRKETLNDALIYLTAARYGLPVLTGNAGDFDLIQQVAGHGGFICYDAVLG